MHIVPTKTDLINVFYKKVDDKYQYSRKNKDDLLHGWISTNRSVGFWIITPSYEFRAGGPLKPDLTSHVGPTTLAVSTCQSHHLLTSNFRQSHKIYIFKIWLNIASRIRILVNIPLINTAFFLSNSLSFVHV